MRNLVYGSSVNHSDFLLPAIPGPQAERVERAPSDAPRAPGGAGAEHRGKGAAHAGEVAEQVTGGSYGASNFMKGVFHSKIIMMDFWVESG